jgi:hypothetical protein
MSPISTFKVLPVCLATAALTTMVQSVHAQAAPAAPVSSTAAADAVPPLTKPPPPPVLKTCPKKTLSIPWLSPAPPSTQVS